MGYHLENMINHAYDGIENCQERIDKLEKLYTNLARCLNEIPLILQDAQEARDLFRNTLHDLQIMERKRDHSANTE